MVSKNLKPMKWQPNFFNYKFLNIIVAKVVSVIAIFYSVEYLTLLNSNFSKFLRQ